MPERLCSRKHVRLCLNRSSSQRVHKECRSDKARCVSPLWPKNNNRWKMCNQVHLIIIPDGFVWFILRLILHDTNTQTPSFMIPFPFRQWSFLCISSCRSSFIVTTSSRVKVSTWNCSSDLNVMQLYIILKYYFYMETCSDFFKVFFFTAARVAVPYL